MHLTRPHVIKVLCAIAGPNPLQAISSSLVDAMSGGKALMVTLIFPAVRNENLTMVQLSVREDRQRVTFSDFTYQSEDN